MNNPKVLYVPGEYYLRTALTERNGQLVSIYSGETVQEMLKDLPAETIVASLDDVLPMVEAAQRKAFCFPPKEITEERFWDMLEVLPPHDWKRTADGESFKMCERTSGDITAIFAKVDGRYWEMSDSITMPHEFIIDKIRQTI